MAIVHPLLLPSMGRREASTQMQPSCPRKFNHLCPPQTPHGLQKILQLTMLRLRCSQQAMSYRLPMSICNSGQREPWTNHMTCSCCHQHTHDDLPSQKEQAEVNNHMITVTVTTKVIPKNMLCLSPVPCDVDNCEPAFATTLPCCCCCCCWRASAA